MQFLVLRDEEEGVRHSLYTADNVLAFWVFLVVQYVSGFFFREFDLGFWAWVGISLCEWVVFNVIAGGFRRTVTMVAYEDIRDFLDPDDKGDTTDTKGDE